MGQVQGSQGREVVRAQNVEAWALGSSIRAVLWNLLGLSSLRSFLTGSSSIYFFIFWAHFCPGGRLSEDIHALIPRTCGCIILYGRRDLADMIQLRTRKWGMTLDYLGGFRAVTEVFPSPSKE